MKKREYCPFCGQELINEKQNFCTGCGKSVKEIKKIKRRKKIINIIRYVIGSIFIFLGLSNLYLNIGIIEIFFGISFFPIIYEKICLLFNIGLKKQQLILSICFPIILCVLLVSIPHYKIFVLETNENNINENDKLEETQISKKINKKIEKSLEAGQSLDSIEYLKENNKYAIKIKYLKSDLSPYVCVTNAENCVKKLLGIQELANIEFECVNNDGTFGFVRYENVSTLNSITIDNTFKYYDSNHNQMQTSIEILREQQINDFKNSCTTFNYKDVLRYPEQYNGKNSYWFGEIVQVVSKDEDSSIFRIDVTCEKYTYLNDYFCTDTIYVYYFGNESFIEHDMVKMWGTMRGNEIYTSIFGASITIPKFNALYMELQ